MPALISAGYMHVAQYVLPVVHLFQYSFLTGIALDSYAACLMGRR